MLAVRALWKALAVPLKGLLESNIHQPNQEHRRDAQPPSQRQLQPPDCRERQENEIQVTENADHPNGDTQGETTVTFGRR